jgi:hypothetical protein
MAVDQEEKRLSNDAVLPSLADNTLIPLSHRVFTNIDEYTRYHAASHKSLQLR